MEGCGGVYAGYHQPLGHRGQRGERVFHEALQLHASQVAHVVGRKKRAHIKYTRESGQQSTSHLDICMMFVMYWAGKINLFY